MPVSNGDGTFMRAYKNNQNALVKNALDADPVAISVINLIKQLREHEWHGTASELLKYLDLLNQDQTFSKSWPRNANVLSGRLKRTSASLREIGIEVEWTKSGNWMIHIVPAPAFNFNNSIIDLHDHEVDDVSKFSDIPEDTIPDLPDR